MLLDLRRLLLMVWLATVIPLQIDDLASLLSPLVLDQVLHIGVDVAEVD